MGPAVWIISLIVILLNIREKKKVRFWMAAGSISCFLGSVMVVAAPGNFVRSAQVASNEYGLLWNCFLRGYAQGKAALEYLFPVVLLLSCLLVISNGIVPPLSRQGGLWNHGTVGLRYFVPDVPDTLCQTGYCLAALGNQRIYMAQGHVFYGRISGKRLGMDIIVRTGKEICIRISKRASLLLSKRMPFALFIIMNSFYTGKSIIYHALPNRHRTYVC